MVLWCLLQWKVARPITLPSNPHFYYTLPNNAGQLTYNEKFGEPLRLDKQVGDLGSVVYVLVDHPERIVMKDDQVGNLWKVNDKLVLKGTFTSR